MLPLFPPSAALLGTAIDRVRQRSAFFICLLALSAALLCVLPSAQDALPDALVYGLRSPIHFLSAWLVPVLILASICVLLEVRRDRFIAFSLIALLYTTLIVVIWQDFPTLDRDVSARNRWATSSESITCIPHDGAFWRNSLNYYAGRELPDCN